MAYTKITLMDKAVEITAAYAKGGGEMNPEVVLGKVYEELKKINEELDQ